MDAIQYPDDPRLAILVGELSVRDPDFRQWWAAHDVAHKTCGTKKLNHPVAGELTLDWEILSCATDPDQQLMVMTAVPGSAAQESLRFLASWTGPDSSPPREPSAPAADRPGETHPRP
ncbi:MmyB family transcriptional regulator [Streptomyces sp. NPDC055157]